MYFRSIDPLQVSWQPKSISNFLAKNLVPFIPNILINKQLVVRYDPRIRSLFASPLSISVWSPESPCLCLSCPELVLCPLEGKLLAVKSGDKNNQHLWWIFIYQCRTALIFSVLVFLTQIGPAQTSYYDRRHSEAHHLKIVFPVNNCIKQQLVHRQHTGGMWSPPH